MSIAANDFMIIEQRSFDLLPLGLCIVDRRMVVHFWNQSLEQWTGISRVQVLGRAYGAAIEGAGSAALCQRVAAVLQEDDHDGSRHPLLDVFGCAPGGLSDAAPMKQRITVRRWDERGELALVIVEDVTTEFRQVRRLLSERENLRLSMRRLEERARAVRMSEERFNFAVRGSSDGIWDWNVLTNEAYYSPRFKELLGYADVEFENVFASFENHLHPEEASRALSAIRAHLELKNALDIEVRLRTKAGDWRWFRVRARAIADSHGSPVRMAGTLTDVDDRKKSEAELQRSATEIEASRQRIEAQSEALMAQAAELEVARRRAEQANQAKTEFLANMSHEIRTPMTAILGFTDVLLTEDDVAQLPAPRIHALETIKRNGEHLLEILNDILDLSKIEASCVRVESIRFSPAKVLADVVALMKVRADAKKLGLTTAYAGPIPETIESDPTRLRQILINLVGNAIKFTELGSVRLEVRLLPADQQAARLQVSVRDTGIGMTAEEMARLFRPFTQADASTTRKFGGSGLGLTISKRFASLLGGDLTFESHTGSGSTFTVTVTVGSLEGVRMIQHSGESPSMPREMPPREKEKGPRLSCRVLIAEDGIDNQRLLAFLLKKAGADVAVVDNGKAAMELALARHQAGLSFDVILMDMQMPIMDGYTSTSRLRAAGYRGAIIALTAHTMTGDRKRCIDAGCDDYATKPIHGSTLISLILTSLAASK